MKRDWNLLMMTCMSLSWLCSCAPAVAANGGDGSDRFVAFTQALKNMGQPTLPMVSHLLLEITANHSKSIVKWQNGQELLIPDSATRRFDFGDGIVAESIAETQYSTHVNPGTTISLNLSADPCVKMKSMVQKFGPRWQQQPTDNEVIYRYTKAEPDITYGAYARLKQSSDLRSGCVFKFDVHIPNK